MCGFVGDLLIRNGSHLPDHLWIQTLEAIHHRGPDSTGTYKDETVRFGFKRLSIIDLEHGDQPLAYSKGRYHIVFNGEIYNYIELRSQLIQRGYTFRTDSDTEVLLALYAADGKNAVKQLRGMYAFAIWDKHKKELFCARDRFGIKPFYYLKTDERFFFASEQKSIMPLLEQISIEQEALQHYATFQFVPEPNTLTKGIHKLLPGHTLTVNADFCVQIEAYAERTFQPRSGPTVTELANQTRKLLTDSVEKHMRSDVPVGAFLSSGIDSTSIAALAQQVHPNLLTFTVGFETEGYSEIAVAKETAKALGVKNIHKVISADEFIQELPNIVWHMDEPVADPAAVPLYFVAQEASKHVKVVLSGEGADELFGGYNIYREPLDLAWFKKLPPTFHAGLKRVVAHMPSKLKGRNYIIRGTTPLNERYIGNAFIFSEKEKTQLFRDYDRTKPYTNVTAPLYEQAKGMDESTIMQFVDMHTWLPGDILVKADRMTMAHSIELRVPFLDKDVFAFARMLGQDMKLSHKTTKFVLRQAMKDLIPANIVPRKKLGFPVPIRVWLKNELYDWAKQLIESSNTEDVFHKPFLLQMLQAHRDGHGDYSRRLWTVLTYMMWHDMHVAKRLISTHQQKDAERCKTLAHF